MSLQALRRALVPQTALALRAAAPAAKGKGKKGAAADTGPIQVGEFNPNICTGANYLTTGSDPVIKPDDEYPEWLWTLLDPPDASDPNNVKYWKRKNKVEIRQRNQLSAKR